MPSVSDIAAAITPTFTPAAVAALAGKTTLQRDVFNNRYLPGYAGLSIHSRTDYINSTITSLSQVSPLRPLGTTSC